MAGVSSLSKMCQEATLCLFRVRVQWKMVTEDIISIRHRRGGGVGCVQVHNKKSLPTTVPSGSQHLEELDSIPSFTGFGELINSLALILFKSNKKTYNTPTK